jgi:hypothetical protein
VPKSGEVALGSKLYCMIQFQTSWWERPSGELRLELPESVRLLPNAEVRAKTLGWGVFRWYVFAEICPTAPGDVPTAQVIIPIVGRNEPLTAEFPAFRVVLPTVTDTAPEIAPLPPTEAGNPWLGAVVLFLFSASAWYWIRRRKGRRKPAGQTLSAVSDSPSLASRLEALRPRLTTPDAALFGELCDLVAEHLREAYNVPATGLTLREQAAWIGQTRALEARLVEPLVAFWHTAEAVRFAGQPASPSQAGKAFEAASNLLQQGRRSRP